MVPSNLIEATFQQVRPTKTPLGITQRLINQLTNRLVVLLQYKTDLIPIIKVPGRTVQPNFVYVVPDEADEGDPKGRTVYLELTPAPEVTYRMSPGSSQQMNVLGIVVFSATMGERGV